MAAAVAIWRTCSVSPASWWRDWVLVASIYWAYSCVKGGSEAWGRVTVSVMAYLFGLYAMGQWPHTLGALRGSP